MKNPQRFASSLLLLAATSLWGQQSSSPLKHTEDVLVTGSYAPIPLEEADRSVSSIELNQSVTQYRNAMDVLSSDASVNLRQRAPGIQGDLSIRGSSFGQTLVMVNGLRLNDAQTAHNNLDLPFPFASLQKVEILKGSGSTLYGSDALGGAVNFLTGIPEASEIRFSLAGGNYGTNQQNAAITWVTKKVSEQLSFSRELSTGFQPDRDYRSLAFGSETILNSGLGNTHVLGGMSDRPFGADQFYGNYPSWERTKGWFAGVTQDLNRKTQAALGYRRHSDLFNLYRFSPQIYQNNHVTESWQTALRRHDSLSSNTSLYYGLEGYRDSIDSSNLGHHQRDRGALYLDLDNRAYRRFSFSAGFREEYFTGGATQFSPSVSGGYWMTERLKLRGSITHAFRLPTYTDLYYSDPANKGNANLKPEKAWNYEGGAQLNLKRSTLDLAFFHRREQNDIDYVRSLSTSPWQAENIDKLRFTGVEVMLRLPFSHSQRFDVSYTGIHGAQEALHGQQSKYVFEHPTHSAAITWQGKMPGELVSRLRLSVIDRYQRDPYPLVEFALEKNFPIVKPFLQITNATNTGYQEISAVRMPGRAILAGIEFRKFRKQ